MTTFPACNAPAPSDFAVMMDRLFPAEVAQDGEQPEVESSFPQDDDDSWAPLPLETPSGLDTWLSSEVHVSPVVTTALDEWVPSQPTAMMSLPASAPAAAPCAEPCVVFVDPQDN